MKIKTHILFFILLLFLNSCSIMPNNPGKEMENIPPETELANIPHDDPNGNSLLSPEITFYWTGADYDGYITSYKYRYCTIKSSDTVWSSWHYISATDAIGNKIISSNSVTLIIESPESKNMHVFEIAAIDNNGAADNTPARVRFCTKKGAASETVLSVYPQSECMAIDNITESWSGLNFIFADADSKYSYKINTGSWSSFSDTNSITLTGKAFSVSGNYNIFFKSKNKYAVEDDTPLQFDIKIIKPDYKKDILLIDMTTDGIGIPGSPTDEAVDTFYDSVCKGANVANYDKYDVKSNGFPSRSTLANYKMLLIYSDNSYSEYENKLLKNDIDALSDYLNTGGKLITSGWIVSNIFFNSVQSDSFFYKYDQVKTGSELFQNAALKFNNLSGYPQLQIDGTKFPPEWSNTFANIQVFTPRAFSENIYTFNSPQNTYNGKALITILKTNTYKTILSSIPLYYFNKTDVTNFLTKAISDFK